MPFLPDAQANIALAAIYKGEAPAPVSRWLGLSTTIPELDETEEAYVNVTEPDAASYARVEVLPGDWTVANRVIWQDVLFPDPVDDLGVILAWVLFDAETDGVATDVGVPAEEMDLQAGSKEIVVTCQIESPADLNAT